jgi:hypothetical protein
MRAVDDLAGLGVQYPSVHQRRFARSLPTRHTLSHCVVLLSIRAIRARGERR